VTIIDRIFNYLLFSIHHLLLLQFLNCVMSVLSLNSYWIGLASCTTQIVQSQNRGRACTWSNVIEPPLSQCYNHNQRNQARQHLL